MIKNINLRQLDSSNFHIAFIKSALEIKSYLLKVRVVLSAIKFLFEEKEVEGMAGAGGLQYSVR